MKHEYWKMKSGYTVKTTNDNGEVEILSDIAADLVPKQVVDSGFEYYVVEDAASEISSLKEMNELFVKEEPAKEEPVKEEPVKEEPVKEEPVKEEPVKEEPVKEEIKISQEELNKFKIETTKEMVNHPNHYGGDTTYECIKVLENWMTKDEYIGFCKGNALKYLCRSGKKDEILQEYKKASWYLNKLIESIEKSSDKN